MLFLNNWVNTTVYKEEHLIAAKLLHFVSTVVLNEDEINAFDVALSLFEDALIAEKREHIQIRANVYLLGSDEISLSVVGDTSMGLYQPSIFLRVHRWRDKNFLIQDMVVIILEELCHCFWLILDEQEVKQKVAQLVQARLPLPLSVLYSRFSLE